MKDPVTRNTNTHYEIIMIPDDAIDLHILEAMAIKVTNDPHSLSFTYKDGIATVSVRKK